MRSTESNNTHGAQCSLSFSLSREPDPCFNLIEILSWPVCQLDKLLQSPPHITHFASFAGQIIRELQIGDSLWQLRHILFIYFISCCRDDGNAAALGDIDTSTCMMQNLPQPALHWNEAAPMCRGRPGYSFFYGNIVVFSLGISWRFKKNNLRTAEMKKIKFENYTRHN